MTAVIHAVAGITAEVRAYSVSDVLVQVTDGRPGPAGPQGDRGRDGDEVSQGALGNLHIQSAPADRWELTHSLLFTPSVTVVDTAGSVVEGDVRYPEPGRIILQFSAPFSGTAYLS